MTFKSIQYLKMVILTNISQSLFPTKDYYSLITHSELTLSRVEKGLPTVSIGIYLRVLYALQLDDDILLIAKEGPIGRGLQDLQLKHRERATKKV